jgi:hypothetical protein
MAGAAPTHRIMTSHACAVQRRRSCAGGNRRIRVDGLCRRAADTRNRHSRVAWSQSDAGPARPSRGGVEAVCCRYGSWSRWCAVPCPFSAPSLVRSLSIGWPDNRRRDSHDGGGRRGSDISTCVTSVQNRPDACVASGLVDQARVKWPPGGREVEQISHMLPRSSIFLRRKAGVIFMRVNAKCAHHMRPPLGRMERRSPAGPFATASGAIANLNPVLKGPTSPVRAR